MQKSRFHVPNVQSQTQDFDANITPYKSGKTKLNLKFTTSQPFLSISISLSVVASETLAAGCENVFLSTELLNLKGTALVGLPVA